jgi:hypothetical protein
VAMARPFPLAFHDHNNTLPILIVKSH